MESFSVGYNDFKIISLGLVDLKNVLRYTQEGNNFSTSV